ncbi:MAG: hypothetical protein SOY97_05890 [Candidatus Metalachnospira sp.]|nr:hypothetical protein [Candidatus Metalachnospira sp.]
MKGIMFNNYHSYNDFYLILNKKTIESPSPKIEKVEIEGGDGAIDLSEAFGEIKYENRKLSFDFSTIIHPSQFLMLYSEIQNLIHGQIMKLILDDDPVFYYIGRVSIDKWKSDKNIGKITIDCDCEPYKYKIRETVISQTINGIGKAVLTNLRKKIVPTITSDGPCSMEFNGFTFNIIEPGSYEFPEFVLSPGNNVVRINGNGKVIFKYREGEL